MPTSTVNDTPHARRLWRSAVRAGVCAALALGAVAVVVPATNATADAATTAYRPVTPCRLLDTRQSPGKPGPGWTTTLAVRGRCGIAADATAVSVTLTVTQADGPGFITTWPSGVGMPTASSNNYAAGETRANGAMLSLGADGNLALYSHAGVHVIVDVAGEFYPATSATAGRYVPLVPFRHLDTRQAPANPIAREGTRTVPLPANVPSDATAIAVMLTITHSPSAGFMTAYPAGTAQPFTSSLNTDRAYQIRTATQIVPVTPSGMNVFAMSGGHLIVDVVGYYTGGSAGASATGLFVPATPKRVLDTRDANQIYPGGAVLATTAGVTGPNAQAVAANVTVTQSGPPGWVTAWAARTAQPHTPAVSYDAAGMTVANLNLISVSSEGIAVASTTGTHAVVDITGWFTGTPVGMTTGPPANSGPTHVQPTGPVGCLQYVPAPTGDGVYQIFPNQFQTVAHIWNAGPKGPIVVVGDSLTHGSAAQTARALRANGWGPICVDGTVSRTVEFGSSSIPDGLDAAYRIRASSPVWNNPAITWVVSLGTNDVGFSAGNASRSDKYVADMRAAIGPNPMSWLNVRTGRGDWQYKEIMFNQSVDRSGMTVIDWYNRMSGSWLAGDRVHLNSTGYQARADMLASSVPG